MRFDSTFVKQFFEGIFFIICNSDKTIRGNGFSYDNTGIVNLN